MTRTAEIRDRDSKLSIAELSVDTIAITHTLEKVGVGDSIKYSDLNKAIGRDVQKDARSNMDSARRILQRDHKMIFSPIRGVGLLRLNDGDIVSVAASGVERQRRASRRTLKVLDCAKYDVLDRKAQTEYNTTLSVRGVLSHVTSNKSVAKVRDRLSNNSLVEPVAVQKTLEFMRA